MRRSAFSVAASSFRALYRNVLLEGTKPSTTRSLPHSHSPRRFLTCSVALGASMAAVGSVMVYSHSRSEMKPVWSSTLSYAEIAQQGKITAPASLQQLPHISLYQYEVCPFCCKVRAFLDYHKIPYEVIEVNPISKGELKWSSYKKVPVIMFGEEQLNDSNVIITTLSEKMKASKSTKQGLFHKKDSELPLAADASPEEKQWRQWVDDRLVRIITANIYRSLNESWETFDYITEHGNFGVASRFATRMFGTATMYIIGKRMPKKYHLEGDLREVLYSAVDEWMEAVGEKDFLGGKKPNLGDLAVYGVINAVHGTKTFEDMMAKTKVSNWFERMSLAIGTSSRINLLQTSGNSNPTHLQT